MLVPCKDHKDSEFRSIVRVLFCACHQLTSGIEMPAERGKSKSLEVGGRERIINNYSPHPTKFQVSSEGKF